MHAFRNTLFLIIKRPFIIAFFGVLSTVFMAINNYNPIIPLISGLTRITRVGVLEGVISLLQVIIEPRIIAIILISFLCISILGAFIGGFLFSGCFYIINGALEGRPRERGEFGLGVRKFFLKTALVSFKLFFSSAVLVLFSSIASVPAIIMTKTVMDGKSDFTLAAVFVDILTACVLLFIFMFFRLYMFFKYPAIINSEKRPFLKYKRMVDRNFWAIAGRFLIFDIVFLAFQYGFSFLEKNSLVSFAVNCVFMALYFGFYVTYIFSLYKEYKEWGNREWEDAETI